MPSFYFLAKTLIALQAIPLPSWLADPLQIEIQRPQRRASPGVPELPDPVARGQDSGSPDEIRACKNIDDLRVLDSKSKIKLRLHSREAFQQLLSSGISLESQLGFLEEDSLNHPDARNLGYLLGIHRQRSANGNDMKDVVKIMAPWIRIHLSLGRILEEDILLLSKFVSHLGRCSGDEDWKCKIAAAILDGLRSSLVFRVQDLEHNTLSLFLESLTYGDFSHKSQAIGIRLIEALQPLNLSPMARSISRFLRKGFRAQYGLRDATEDQALNVQMFPEAPGILLRLPEDTRRSVITRTSRSLIEGRTSANLNRDAWLSMLGTWWTMLAKCDMFHYAAQTRLKRRTESMMGQQPLEILAPYLRHFSDREKARFLLTQWFAGPENVLHWFYRVHRPGDSAAPFLRMLECPFPRPLVADQEQMKRLFTLLKLMHMSETIVQIIKKSVRAPTQIPLPVIFHTMNNYLETSLELAQGIFKADTRISLEMVPDLALKMIRNPATHPDTVWTYEQADSQPHETPIISQKTMNLRLRLFEQMAFAYAQAPHLRPRRAFRKVYRCYRHHRRERLGPITPLLSRALTRSGIIRPLQCKQWVSSVKLRWILSIIREAEGDDVADQVDLTVYKWRARVVSQMPSVLRQLRFRVALQRRIGFGDEVGRKGLRRRGFGRGGRWWKGVRRKKRRVWLGEGQSSG